MASNVVEFPITKDFKMSMSAAYSNSDCGQMELSYLGILSGSKPESMTWKEVYRKILEQIKTGKFRVTRNASMTAWHDSDIYKAQIILSDYKGRTGYCVNGIIREGINMRKEGRLRMVVSAYTRNPNSSNMIRTAIIRTNGYWSSHAAHRSYRVYDDEGNNV